MSAVPLPPEPPDLPASASGMGRTNKPPVRRAPIAWERLGDHARPHHRSAPAAGSLFSFESPGPAQFVVPRTFGMSAILGIMTALAVLFGGFRIYNAHPVLYLFFGMQVLFICVAQMFHGKTPRFASVVAGGVLLPLFMLGWIGLWDRRAANGALCLLVLSVPIGGFFGYLTGTMAAGVFLVMDAAEKFLTGAGRQTA